MGNAVRNIQADYTGRPWLATSRGLYSQFSADSFSLASFGVASYHQESVNNIFAIASGTTDLYVGTAQGFVVLDSASSSDTTRYDTADGLPGQLVGTLQIEVDADTLWMGTIKGLTLFVVDSATINTSEIDSTAGKLIHAMAIDCTGGTWYGSDKGLERQYLSYWFSYDTSDGLSSVPVYALAVDTSGNLWIGNDAGVDVFDMDTTWTNYDDDSLGVGPQVRALAHDKVDNIMWIGT
ncbi:MAG: hypothetical protein KOO63_05325 [Bacteroidales bacterium]|nr:hypothetical protein [Candidatus Latescibacterota bacterium]